MLQIMRYSEAEMGCLRCYVCSSVLSGNQWEPGNATITDYTLDSVAPSWKNIIPPLLRANAEESFDIVLLCILLNTNLISN